MSDTLGIYVHIPFCKSKCKYCDFYSAKADEKAYDEYTSTLMEAICFWGKINNKNVSTVYFGGGTPSVLGADRLCSLKTEISHYFHVYQNAEVTVEVNPESGKELDFSMLRQAGFNRISMGLQSSNEKELKALGRIHTSSDAAETVRLARKAGFDNISLDLMLGIPYQTRESLRESIDFCASLGVKHISSYILKIEEGTPFEKLRGVLPFPDDDAQADLYLYAVEYLAEKGFYQYEISNFAVPGYESRHNMRYWRCEEYIGIGASAHSFFAGRRLYYPRSMEDFRQNRFVVEGLGGDMSEYIMLSLRLREGLNFEELKIRYPQADVTDIRKKLAPYVKAGLMETDGNRAYFTPKGFLVSNSIIAKIIP